MYYADQLWPPDWKPYPDVITRPTRSHKFIGRRVQDRRVEGEPVLSGHPAVHALRPGAAKHRPRCRPMCLLFAHGP